MGFSIVGGDFPPAEAEKLKEIGFEIVRPHMARKIVQGQYNIMTREVSRWGSVRTRYTLTGPMVPKPGGAYLHRSTLDALLEVGLPHIRGLTEREHAMAATRDALSGWMRDGLTYKDTLGHRSRGERELAAMLVEIYPLADLHSVAGWTAIGMEVNLIRHEAYNDAAREGMEEMWNTFDSQQPHL